MTALPQATTGSPPPTPPVRVELEGATQSFPGGAGPVVRDVSLVVDKPECVAILGPSGCGKSTILRMVSGMHPRGVTMPSSGKALVDGAAVTGPHDAVLTVWQKPILPRVRSVEGIAGLPFAAALWGKGVGRVDRRKRVDEVIKAVDLEEHRHKTPRQLSGGQAQRVALAQALVVRPKILCLDEPFSALDPMTRAEMQELVVGLWAKYPCVALFVTHDVSEALVVADRVVVLSTRPATVLADIAIDEPKPRSDGWLRSPQHDLLEARILRLIRDARPKAMASGQLRVEV